MTQTALFTAPARSLGHLLAVPFKAFGTALVALAEASPRMQQINRLNAMTDDQLAALGKTRAGEVRRMFGAHFYI